MDVVLVRWPEERDRLEVARANGTPRLLVVEAPSQLPGLVDSLEDWVRSPVDPEEMRVRVATLAYRAGRGSGGGTPWVDHDGVLHHDGRSAVLSPTGQALAGALVERFSAVVSRDALMRRAWPSSTPSRNLLDVQMLRLRRDVLELGLGIRTVRSRGYLLHRASR